MLGKAAGGDPRRGDMMAQAMKHRFSGRTRKQSEGFKQGNMAAFIHGGSRRKYKKRVKGK